MGPSSCKQQLLPKSRTGPEVVSPEGKRESRTDTRSFTDCRGFEPQIYATKKDSKQSDDM